MQNHLEMSVMIVKGGRGRLLTKNLWVVRISGGNGEPPPSMLMIVMASEEIGLLDED
jgi:hypothetical protein